MLRTVIALAAAAIAGAAPAPGAAAPREIVIASEALLPEHAPRNIEPFVRRLEKLAGLREGTLRGRAFSRPREALDYVHKNPVAFAILPVHQFLEGRKALKLEILGRAVGLEGRRPAYWGVARVGPRSWGHLEDAEGARLALTEGYDNQWLKVLMAGNVRDPMARYRLVEVASGKEALAAVLAQKADVALVYEPDFQAVRARVERKVDLVWVYTSGGLPPPPLVAVGRAASKAERRKLTEALGKMCKGDGADVCGRMAILYMEAGKADEYDLVIEQYEKY